jgi:magnesium-transporting ATPase (P-type)
MTESRVPLKDLILVPSVITLGITLLRLVGELQGWSPALFGKAAGGGGSLIGISWLILVFGGWFGWRLTQLGQGAKRPLKVSGIALMVGLVVGFAAFGVGKVAGQNGFFAAFVLGSIAAVFVTRSLWPELWAALLAYAFAARVPVAVLMLFAILGNWGTHYDVPPPNFPDTYSPLVKWLLIGVLPQMTIWIYLTVVGGLLAGGVAGAIARKKA